jgi:hypothetical protein
VKKYLTMKIALKGFSITAILLHIFTLISHALDDILSGRYDPTWHLRLYYQNGMVAGTNAFLLGENESNKRIDRFQAISIQGGVQTFGIKSWQATGGYQSYGARIKVRACDFQVADLVGWYTGCKIKWKNQ